MRLPSLNRSLRALHSVVVATLFLFACGDDQPTLQCPGGKTCGFTSIAAGYEHTCAIYSVVEGAADNYGQVVCWGENRDGRCGDGSGFGESQALRPMVVADLTDAVLITAGGTQTCAQRANGQTVCWGGNAFGELGNGQSDGSFGPLAVTFPPVARDVVQLAAGGTSLGGTSCARDSARKLWCWGRNHERQVRPSEGEVQDRPIQIQGIDAAADLSVAQDYACAINGGALQCWGNSFGTAPSGLGVTLDAIEGARLSSRGFMTCVRGATDVKCFTGLFGTSRILDLVSTPLANTQQVATGALHTCALTNAGNVVCWGSPSGGRLGLGGTNADDPTNELSLAPVVLENALGAQLTIEQIASGASHSCALDAEHDIYCWGDNTKGQLGNGTETSSSVPSLVQLQAN